MKRTSAVTLVVLGAVVVGVIVMLMREAGRGPVFRAADHATYEECIAAIPFERGSLEHDGSEAACGYEQQRRLRQQQGR